MVQAATAQRVAEFARAVAGEDGQRHVARADRAELGHRDLPVGEHLEQEGLEGLVSAVDLVDQEHAGLLADQDLQQRAFQQVVAAEQVRLARLLGIRLVQPDREQLATVVPLVGGLRQVQALVALKPYQAPVHRRGQRRRKRRLADTRIALEQQRALQLAGQPKRGRQRLVGDVADLVQALAQLGVGHARLVRPGACRTGRRTSS